VLSRALAWVQAMIELKMFAFLALLLIACGSILAYHGSLKRQLRKTLANRDPVPAYLFGVLHYADPGKAEIGSFIMAKFQELTGYDFTGVIPSDRIVVDLHMDELDSLILTEIVAEVEAQFAIQINNEDVARIRTIGEFVDIVASKRLNPTSG
jgi:acyl carrier protein